MTKKTKILLSFSAIMAALIYFIMSSHIISQKKSEQHFVDFNINVSEDKVRSLVTVDDIKSILQSYSIGISGKPIGDINIHEIEKLLLSKSYIKKAEVYADINGIINIRIEQRKPIIRINTRGSGFYMDENGFIFPLSKSFTDYVPIVTGNPPLPSSMKYKDYIPQTEDAKFLQDLLVFAHFLQNDSYWNSMIEQINVVNKNDVELITRVGSQVVKLGGFDDFEYKLRKLDVFYRNGMPAVGWNTYKTINLAYSNQVVCK